MHTQRRYATCPQGMSKKKKRKDTYPKKVCHTPTRCVKKKEREKGKYSSYQKHYKGKRIHIKDFSSIIHQKYPHTCTSWSGLMTCFSFGSGLWLSKIWEASLPLYPPYLQIHQKEAIRSRMKKERRIKRPWWEMKHIERSERSPKELHYFFSKTLKTSGLTVEQRSGKWYSTSCSDSQPPKMRMML